jgi:hypothetical protein
MATQAQIDANRRNALKSTGPRTEQGKSTSRWNALKTGIHAASVVIRGEDPAELEQLTAEYHQQFRPPSAVERFLVDSMIMAEWRLRRYRQIESQLWAVSPSFADAFAGNTTIARLERRIDAAERSYHRALRELRRLQASVEPESVEEDAAELASFRQVLQHAEDVLRSVPSGAGLNPPASVKRGHEDSAPAPRREILPGGALA